jgi:Uma2 family endonuclease
VTAEQIRTLKAAALNHFLPFAPAFVVELLSKSDSRRETERKMLRWMENGVQVGWMIDPYKRQVTIYTRGKRTHVEAGQRVAGTGPIEGFELDLSEVWLSYELLSRLCYQGSVIKAV